MWGDILSGGKGQGRSPLVKLRGITKRFGGVIAVEGVDLDIYSGEIIGLVGDNGAGKSTLIKILSGAYRPDQGHIFFDGQQVVFNSPRDAKELGIETVYQDLALVDTLDVPGNIFLGRELIRFRLGPLRVLNKPLMRQRSQELLEQLGIHSVPLDVEVEWLSGGQRQSVAVSRALYTEPKLVILDEPTAALAVREVGRVLELMRNLRERGIAVIFISHTLQEIFEVSDRIVVLRKGQKVADLLTPETSQDEVVKLMIGRNEKDRYE